jgi:hypothetical protein
MTRRIQRDERGRRIQISREERGRMIQRLDRYHKMDTARGEEIHRDEQGRRIKRE